MSFVIIAGCSVLDINDYNGFYSGKDHTDSPGKRWETTGPELLLGYNQAAPSDKNGGRNIIDRFFYTDPITVNNEAKVIEWRAANKAEKAWNACAIITNDSYYYFKYSSFLGGALTAEWNKVAKSDW